MNKKVKNKSGTLFGDILSSLTKYFLVLVAVVVVGIALSGIKVVKSGEVALILRFGRLVGDSYEKQIHEPGLLFAFPYIIDEVITVPTGSVIEQKVMTHYTLGTMTTLKNNGYVITGDQNILLIGASVKYVITDAVAYVKNVDDIGKLMNSFVSSAMVEGAACLSADEILTSGKDAYAKEVLRMAQQKLSAAATGITLGSVELTTVTMPEEVRSTYELVNSAAVSAATRLEQAKQYRENLIPGAEAKANAGIAEARSAYAGAVAAANGELSEFWGTLEEYRANPDAVITRIYSEKVAGIIKKLGKVNAIRGGTHIVIGE